MLCLMPITTQGMSCIAQASKVADLVTSQATCKLSQGYFQYWFYFMIQLAACGDNVEMYLKEHRSYVHIERFSIGLWKYCKTGNFGIVKLGKT